MKFRRNLFARLIATLVFVSNANAIAAKGNANVNTNSNINSGQNFDCSSNPSLCGGNSGNGVGNTGPGNQGNAGSNGNTGGTNISNPGNTNSGGSNVGTGNSGNGVGNTGPGNQGNTSNNGNAGGDKGGSNNGGGANGNSNGGGSNGGGANGNANGGSSNGGGANGNSNGNSNGGSSNGGGANGNSNGNANGGSNNGGDNGNSNGNSNGGGSNGGGANGNSNGNANGGSSNGGDNGNSNGNSNGGSNGGGENGNSNGNDNGGDTGGKEEEKPPVEKEKEPEKKNEDDKSSDNTKAKEDPKKSLAVKLRPIFHIDYDFSERIVAVDPAKITGMPELTSIHAPTDYYKNIASPLQTTTTSTVYQKTTTELIEGGVGLGLQFYFKNATGLAAQFWAMIGTVPIKGKEVTSVRYTDTLAQAKAVKGYERAPLEIQDIRNYRVGESVTYASRGGIVYLAGTGFGMLGLNSTSVAQGIWETYIEKVSPNYVYVKITETELKALSVGASAALIQTATSNFKSSDDGFSYLININDTEASKVYFDLVRGNVAAAQKYAEELKAKQIGLSELTVQRLESFKRTSRGKASTFFFGLPIVLNTATSKSKIEAFSTTDLHLDNQKVDAQFAIYDKTTASKVFGTHKNKTEGFTSLRYKAYNLATGALNETGEMGQFTWLMQDEATSDSDYRGTLNEIITATGLDMIKINVAKNDPDDLGYSSVVANVMLNPENMKSLQAKAKSLSTKDLRTMAEQRARYAYDRKGDKLCPYQNHNAMNDSSVASCLETVTNETVQATMKMQEAFKKMVANYSNDVEYTKAFAELGKQALTNQVTLGMMLSLAGEGADVIFSTEGTMFKSYVYAFKTTAKDGELRAVPTTDSQAAKFMTPFNKKSRFHGLITTKSLSGYVAP